MGSNVHSIFSAALNLPYTLIGFALALVSFPTNATIRRHPACIVFKVTKMWWTTWYVKGARAVNIGNTVILGPHVVEHDLEHELIHVEQYSRFPLVFPILYYYELARKGYRANRFEAEAYERAGNVYKG